VIRALIGVLDWHLTAQQALALPVLFAPVTASAWNRAAAWKR
jgi:hypothetical protein